MQAKRKKDVLDRIARASGEVSLYYKNLATREEISVNADRPLVAASIIKLPIMVEAFRQMDCGMANADETFIVLSDDKMPGCGVLTHMQSGTGVKLIDLVTLMIIVSDNTATNMLIRRLGIDAINRTINDMGLAGSALNRRLFDTQQAEKGVQNTVSAADMGLLLENLYRGTLISPDASRAMLDILKNQKLRAKIPFYLGDLDIAHKTGEDDGIAHDVGIVYAKQPFIACFLSNKTDAPAFIRTIQDASAILAGREPF